jgi:hypothetical protein
MQGGGRPRSQGFFDRLADAGEAVGAFGHEEETWSVEARGPLSTRPSSASPLRETVPLRKYHVEDRLALVAERRVVNEVAGGR